MAFDRKDFAASLKEKHAERQSALIPVAQIVQGAAVVADNLQRTPEWARYVTYLQGYVERMKKRKELAQHKLGDPSVVDDQQVRKLRQDIFVADVTMETLTFAIELPAFILKGGEEADKFIAEWEKKREATPATS